MASRFSAACVVVCLLSSLSACSDKATTSGNVDGSDDGTNGNGTGAANGTVPDGATTEPVDDAGLDQDANTSTPCKTQCEADDCGQVPDGCSGFLSCDQCLPGYTCGGDPARMNKCALNPSTCTPIQAADACVEKCGAVSDGCSDVIQCNSSNGGLSCTADQVCGGFAGNARPNACVDKPRCTPTDCDTLGLACGLTGDGCGGELDCSAAAGCTGDKVCGTGNDFGKCVDVPSPCQPKTALQACAGTCGVVGDGCNATIDCEALAATRCPSGQTCGGGGVPNQCGSGAQGCTPIAAATVCRGKCGSQSDGCGGTYACGATNGGQTCDANAGESCGGGGVQNECGKPACVPKTFAAACPGAGSYDSCGKVTDGCGELIDCGGCPTSQTCGLKTANLCADQPVCKPVAAAMACAGKCGTVPDGCGGTYSCSAANGGITCGGAQFCGATQPNLCGTPVTTCMPKTCATLGHSCGLASDGCGNIINCWPGCAPSDRNCAQNKMCQGEAQACLANATTGAQTCVTGTGGCTGPLCNALPGCSPGSLTRLTGTVRTPGRVQGANVINQIAVPNAVVYIPSDPNAALPTILEGVVEGSAASCGRCDTDKLVADGQTVLASAVTDYKGEFTLEGRIPVGVPFKLVVKVGKWRRVIQVPAGIAKSCASASLTSEYTRLSKTGSDGAAGTHLPKVAISTGEVDAMECVFRSIGIEEAEFTVPSGSGRIHMYRNNGARMRSITGCKGTYNAGPQDKRHSCAAENNAGCTLAKAGCSWVYTDTSVPDTNLYGSQATLSQYDMVVFDCEGEEHFKTDSSPSRIVKYVDNGGKMFASHYAYTWIENNGTLDPSADWGASGTADSGTGFISLPSGPTARTRANRDKSPLFRNWLDWQGALTGTTAGTLNNPVTPQFSITDPRDRAGAQVGSSTDEWVYRTANGSKVQQLSFNTPYAANAANICGRVAYSGFHVAAADNGGDNDFFPGVCSNSELTAQEKVLVFMLFDLGACVSTGAPPQPPQCKPKTAADLCPNVNDACGFVSDGCGGVVDCAGCSAGSYCDGNACRTQQCTPATCASLGYTCGLHADGCGGIARGANGQESCGACAAGQTCGLGGPGLCGSATCTPIPKATACPAQACGQVSDGCGGIWDCGACASGKVCGGGGPNLCGAGSCAPIPITTACAGLSCGFASDGCGGTWDCGMCKAPDSCGGGGKPNVCGRPVCTPLSVANACKGLECGWASDGCGGAVQCGECKNGGVCGGAGPNLCGATCAQTSCMQAGAECGVISDLCGGILQCGQCPAGQVCGANSPNKCGTGVSCTPTSCASAQAECGLIGDGCGNVLNCGTCKAPGETCGGAGQANQCGLGTGGCNQTTCAAQQVECGAASDGCGGVLDCGGCASGAACEAGVCGPIIQ